MASSVKRAATSPMRVAPLVMTMNWMTTRMMKMTTVRAPEWVWAAEWDGKVSQID